MCNLVADHERSKFEKLHASLQWISNELFPATIRFCEWGKNVDLTSFLLCNICYPLFSNDGNAVLIKTSTSTWTIVYFLFVLMYKNLWKFWFHCKVDNILPDSTCKIFTGHSMGALLCSLVSAHSYGVEPCIGFGPLGPLNAAELIGKNTYFMGKLIVQQLSFSVWKSYLKF